MKTRTKSIMAGLALAAITIPGTVAAVDAGALALAVAETEQQNLAWYTDLDTDALQNESCREDLGTPVFQPQVDTNRVIVTGDITAVGNIACADIQLESNATIVGEMILEYRTPSGGWIEVSEAKRDLRGSMVTGIGQAHGVVKYTFGYDEAGVDRPLRVCIRTIEPDPSPWRCAVALASSAKVAFAE